MIFLSRRVSFSMGHRLHNADLSDEHNRKLYGKCNNPNGHGHQYTVEATLGGDIDPQTGFCANLVHLDTVLQKHVVERFDHLDFDRDFPEFERVVSSGENLARVFWDILAPHFGDALVRVRVEETEKNSFDYYGEIARIPQ